MKIMRPLCDSLQYGNFFEKMVCLGGKLYYNCNNMIKQKSILLSLIFLSFLIFFQGCANSHVKAWNYYEKGMLLVFEGYDPAKDKTDKVEKLYSKAIETNENLPGVYASLGTYKAKKGNIELAREFWTKEMVIHPESKKAMELVLKDEKEKDKEMMFEDDLKKENLSEEKIVQNGQSKNETKQEEKKNNE